jgi:hypothetical protein
MNYQLTSLKEVIGRIIRNTRVQDASYIIDMHDWVYEAMQQMQTHQSLEGVYEPVQVKFHKAKWPCGLIYIDAIEYKGQRVPVSNSVRTANRELRQTDAELYISTIDKTKVSSIKALYLSAVEQVLDKTVMSNVFYSNETPGYITTSIADGTFIVYYRRIPTDVEGLPLIPDNENYKQAIYWYVRAMMIGAGYEDKVFKYEQCFDKFENLYAPRAVAEIRFPSPDEMENRIKTLVRFIPPQNYYENFFYVDRKEEMYDLSNYDSTSSSTGVNPQQPYIAGTNIVTAGGSSSGTTLPTVLKRIFSKKFSNTFN